MKLLFLQKLLLSNKRKHKWTKKQNVELNQKREKKYLCNLRRILFSFWCSDTFLCFLFTFFFLHYFKIKSSIFFFSFAQITNFFPIFPSSNLYKRGKNFTNKRKFKSPKIQINNQINIDHVIKMYILKRNIYLHIRGGLLNIRQYSYAQHKNKSLWLDKLASHLNEYYQSLNYRFGHYKVKNSVFVVSSSILII